MGLVATHTARHAVGKAPLEKGVHYQAGTWKYRTLVDLLIPLSYDWDGVVAQVPGEWCRVGAQRLFVRAGYYWDGPSGPTIDWPRKHVMRASLAHDALYQLMREGVLDREEWRQPADYMLYLIATQDGMWRWRARGWYRAVRKHAESATYPREA